MNQLSTIICACGNPLHLEASVQSALSISHEVIIVDIGLADVAREKLQSIQQVRIVTEEPVSYVELIRERSKSYADTEYILFLDPDEIIPESLSAEIETRIRSGISFLSIPRKNMIWGAWIRHARWWPDYQIRIFQKDAVTWGTTIHSQPNTTGEGYSCPPEEQFAIMHYNYESIDEYLQKMIRYAKSEAAAKIKNNESYTLAQGLSDGTREFISRYFADDGYKEGMHGFALSFLQMMYYPLVYFYVWEGRKYEQKNEEMPYRVFFGHIGDFFTQVLHWHANVTGSFRLKLQLKLIRFILKQK